MTSSRKPPELKRYFIKRDCQGRPVEEIELNLNTDLGTPVTTGPVTITRVECKRNDPSRGITTHYFKVMQGRSGRYVLVRDTPKAKRGYDHGIADITAVGTPSGVVLTLKHGDTFEIYDVFSFHEELQPSFPAEKEMLSAEDLRRAVYQAFNTRRRTERVTMLEKLVSQHSKTALLEASRQVDPTSSLRLDVEEAWRNVQQRRRKQ